MEPDSSKPTPVSSNEPTLLSRLDRLDVMMGYLEEIWNGKLRSGSSEISSPKWHIERRCLLPMNDAIVETKVKGNLVDRLRFLEQHVLQLSLQTEKEIEEEIDSENKKKKSDEERIFQMHGGSKKSYGKKKKKGTKKR
ncbi:hypothetical protein ZOSMA_52G00600 [Zostera marina]|uniref:Uncharacterized protein n=1 Tax=Zostera marina TaxID=29655 RepID=A0A0K9NXC4_ZOSMR|nr:hypothetical protein ZOSMA_52G00600 [Zostera marina]